MMKEELIEDEVVMYCTKCFSLDIRYDNKHNLYCHHCGSGPKKLDVTTMDKWEKIYIENTGHRLLSKEPEYLEDLRESYKEDTDSVLSLADCYENDINVREKMNLKIS